MNVYTYVKGILNLALYFEYCVVLVATKAMKVCSRVNAIKMKERQLRRALTNEFNEL